MKSAAPLNGHATRRHRLRREAHGLGLNTAALYPNTDGSANTGLPDCTENQLILAGKVNSDGPMKSLIFLVCAVWFCQAAIADTTSFTSVADTTISGNNGARASGVTAHMIVGHLSQINTPARGLLRFDLSSLQSGIIVTSVTLRVSVTASASAATDTHSVHPLNAAWAETSATWIDSGLAPWEEQGGDFAGTPDASVGIAGIGAYTFSSTASLITTVRMWVTNAASNNGWILRSESEAGGRSGRRVNTREASMDRPTLTVGFRIPPITPPVPVITSPRQAGNQFVFNFVAAAGHSYTVEFKDNLNVSNWTTHVVFPAPTQQTNFTVLDSLNGNRFFRVRAD